MKSKKQEQLEKGKLVRNSKNDKIGVVIKTSIHDGYYFVFSGGCLSEWHISNIK